MQPYEIVLLIITAVIIIAITGVIISRNAKKKMYYKLLASFGQLPKNDYSYEEYESISHFLKTHLKMVKIILMISHGMTLIWIRYS